MASCSKCGAKFGCGCQLINGLCAACNIEATKAKQTLKNVISKAYRLCGLR
jgi:hypothetical protein